MKKYLKTGSIELDGDLLHLTELSAAAQIDLLELKDRAKSLALVCKHGVDEWRDESVEDIASHVSVKDLGEIAREIYKLSGVDVEELVGEKKPLASANGLDADSFSDLP